MLSDCILNLNKLFVILIFINNILSSVLPEKLTTLASSLSISKNSLCDNGQNQSPINILSSSCITKEYIPVKFMDELLFESEIVVKNNDETAKITFLDKTIKSKIQGGPMLENIYIIDNIHFHWGTRLTEGCEHTIDNKSFPMETHIIAYKDTYMNIEDAETNRGIVVLSLLYKSQKESNNELKSLVHAVTEILQPDTTNNENGNILKFLKDYISGGFYTYEGSLTTGTCAEGVLWIVYKNPIPIGKSQVLIFQDIINNNADEIQNWRKTFPLNNREVYQSSF